jgi:hypothetical protein
VPIFIAEGEPMPVVKTSLSNTEVGPTKKIWPRVIMPAG